MTKSNDYKSLEEAMQKAFDDKIYDNKKDRMRENLRKWAGSHITPENQEVFEMIADKMYRESFERYRTQEGYTVIHFRSGDKYVIRDKRGRFKKFYRD